MLKKFAVYILLFLAMTAYETEAKDAYYYYDDAEDGLTEETAYIIRNARDMLVLSVRIETGKEPAGRYYKLSRDLTQSPALIGSKDKPFTGHFDGCGHTITSYITLFDYIETDGFAVKNLNLLHGDFAGIATRLVSGIIHNCSVKGIAPIKSQSTTGGIAAMVSSGGIIRDCTASVSIDINAAFIADVCAGGIAGRLEGGAIENCTFTGTISAGGKSSYAGGIVGYSDGGLIANCTSSAAIRTFTAQEAYYGYEPRESYAGGTAGFASYTTITGSTSGGSLKSEHWAGGVAGKVIESTVRNNTAGSVIMSGAQHAGEITGGTEGLCRIEGNTYTAKKAVKTSENTKQKQAQRNSVSTKKTSRKKSRK